MFASFILVIIYLSFISLGLPDSLLGSAWPSMYYLLDVPPRYIGFISMIISGGTVVSSVFSAKIINRFGTGIVTAFSVLITAAALIGFSISGAFWELLLFAIPLGLGGGSVDAALNNYVALHYKARHMSWLHCFWGVGASLGPIIMSSFLISKHSWTLGYMTVGIIQLCLTAALFASLPLWKNKTAQKTRGGRLAGQTNSTNYKSINFKQLFHIAGVKQALAAFFCYCSVEWITGLWGSSYLVIVKNIPPEIAAQWIAFFYIGITLGRFISGFVTMKLNNKQMIRLGQIITGGGLVFLILPLGNAALLPALFMIGLGCAPIFPSLLHETPKNFGEGNSQAVIGIQMASAYIGTTLMPPVFGWAASYINFNIFPVFIGAILVILIIMTETLNRAVR
ncbi:MAG: MFS transporter [Spirochaetaceae bacterium]|jgi:fucose permease|nr:MFS transporter [Spirochaetaceae bacterium]